MIILSKIWHDRKLEAINKLWGSYGTVFPLRTEKGNMRYFKADSIIDISYSWPIAEELDCDYIWIEVVKTHPSVPEKVQWLPKILSKKWLILRYGYEEPFTPIRPMTYIEDKGKMKFEKTIEALEKLRQQKHRFSFHES